MPMRQEVVRFQKFIEETAGRYPVCQRRQRKVRTLASLTVIYRAYLRRGWYQSKRTSLGNALQYRSLNQRTRLMSCTQLVSQVLPSSGESACSQWHDVGVMLDQMKRARTRFPLTVSSP
jgi:predicted RNA polymerase sigma factor